MQRLTMRSPSKPRLRMMKFRRARRRRFLMEMLLRRKPSIRSTRRPRKRRRRPRQPRRRLRKIPPKLKKRLPPNTSTMPRPSKASRPNSRV